MLQKCLWCWQVSAELPKLVQNKCSVGPETSRPEVEKLAARVSFPREKVFIPRSDSCVAEAGGRGYTVRPRNEFRGLTVV